MTGRSAGTRKTVDLQDWRVAKPGRLEVPAWANGGGCHICISALPVSRFASVKCERPWSNTRNRPWHCARAHAAPTPFHHSTAWLRHMICAARLRTPHGLVSAFAPPFPDACQSILFLCFGPPALFSSPWGVNDGAEPVSLAPLAERARGYANRCESSGTHPGWRVEYGWRQRTPFASREMSCALTNLRSALSRAASTRALPCEE